MRSIVKLIYKLRNYKNLNLDVNKLCEIMDQAKMEETRGGISNVLKNFSNFPKIDEESIPMNPISQGDQSEGLNIFKLYEKKELVLRLTQTLSKLINFADVKLDNLNVCTKIVDYATVSKDTTETTGDHLYRKEILESIIPGILSVTGRSNGVENPSAIFRIIKSVINGDIKLDDDDATEMRNILKNISIHNGPFIIGNSEIFSSLTEHILDYAVYQDIFDNFGKNNSDILLGSNEPCENMRENCDPKEKFGPICSSILNVNTAELNLNQATNLSLNCLCILLCLYGNDEQKLREAEKKIQTIFTSGALDILMKKENQVEYIKKLIETYEFVVKKYSIKPDPTILKPFLDIVIPAMNLDYFQNDQNFSNLFCTFALVGATHSLLELVFGSNKILLNEQNFNFVKKQLLKMKKDDVSRVLDQMARQYYSQCSFSDYMNRKENQKSREILSFCYDEQIWVIGHIMTILI